jgi:hypothetical protein
MPAKLDRCVDRVMAKGNDKSSAFAICNKSLGLTKVAISAKLAKKVFNIRYAKNAAASDKARIPFSDAFGKVERSGLTGDRLKKFDRAQIIARRASEKLDNASNSLRAREVWDKNLKEYGKRSPSLVEKIKHKIKSAISENGLSGAEKRRLAPAMQRA